MRSIIVFLIPVFVSTHNASIISTSNSSEIAYNTSSPQILPTLEKEPDHGTSKSKLDDKNANRSDAEDKSRNEFAWRNNEKEEEETNLKPTSFRMPILKSKQTKKILNPAQLRSESDNENEEQSARPIRTRTGRLFFPGFWSWWYGYDYDDPCAYGGCIPPPPPPPYYSPPPWWWW